MIVLFPVLAVPLGAGTLTASLTPASGTINGLPGSTIGWGFDILWDDPTNWITFTSSALTSETNPSIGTYTDFIGLQGGPSPFAALSPSTHWVQAFDALNQAGAGSFAVDPGAVLGSQDNGTLVLNYDIYAGDPASAQYVGSDTVRLAFTVNVGESQSGGDGGSATPEPATILLGLGGILILTRFRCYRA